MRKKKLKKGIKYYKKISLLLQTIMILKLMELKKRREKRE
jgi:hypothetical protein